MSISKSAWRSLGTAAAICAVLGGLFAGAYFAWVRTPSGPGRVKPVPPGDQEIAWIAPATSGVDWERLVKAVRVLAEQWSKLHGGESISIADGSAFLPLTADVPEIGIRFGTSETLWIRWYKLSSDTDAAHWIGSLERRNPPPIAIVGGDTSDRALALAEILEKARAAWPGPPPILLITTATAERYMPPGRPELEFHNDDWPRLMAVYPGRSFRFAFTNTRMVQALLDFASDHPNLWPDRGGVADPTKPFFLFTLTWLDDNYSKDLAYSFQKLYSESLRRSLPKDTPLPCDEDFIHYSIGDFYQPNPREEMAVGLFLANSARRGNQRELMVLPTGTQRARRFLRTLCRRAPSELRDIVVANGDSISFNSLYRDRDHAWNVQDVPVPLIVFSHRDPIDPASGFAAKDPVTGRVDNTSTQDLLLYRDLVEAFVLAAFHDGRLLSNPDEILARLKNARWSGHNVTIPPAARSSRGDDAPADDTIPFFDAEGNRRDGTGEHIVWLKPIFEGARVLPEASLGVYRLETHDGRATFHEVGRPLSVYYDRSAERGAVHRER